jgi:hypothetical protein
VKFINEGVSKFNIDLFYYFFLFREEIKEKQKYLNEKHRPLKEGRLYNIPSFTFISHDV